MKVLCMLIKIKRIFLTAFSKILSISVKLLIDYYPSTYNDKNTNIKNLNYKENTIILRWLSF